MKSVSGGASHRFEFRVEGKSVSPLTVPLFKLLEILKRTNAAIKATGGKGVEEGLNLVGVMKGSVACMLSANDEAFAATNRLTNSLASGNIASLPVSARAKVYDLWEYTVENDWEALGFYSEGGNEVLAKIHADLEGPDRNAYKGITTIYGRCDRTGGSNRPTAQVRLLNGQTVYAKLASKELAQQLGQRLYQIVGLEGQATWDNETQKLIAFMAERLAPFHDQDEKGKKRTISEVFQNLAKAAGDRWENTDPNEFIKELRDD